MTQITKYYLFRFCLITFFVKEPEMARFTACSLNSGVYFVRLLTLHLSLF